MKFAIIKSWFTGNAFQGQGFVFKTLRFLNLMEDKAVKFSLTGAQMWATTVMDIHTQVVSHDHIAMGIAAGTNGMAMVAHGFKRGQEMKNASAPVAQSDPPWKGEGPGP